MLYIVLYIVNNILSQKQFITYTTYMSKDDNYTNVILEDINAKFDQLIEVVGQLSDDLKQKANQTTVDEIKTDAKIIKAAVIDTNHQVSQLEQRVIHLEA
jgi:hypothetical protein